MSAADITAILNIVVVILTSMFVPLYLRHRANKTRIDHSTVVSWEGITDRLEKERDRLQVRLDKSESDHEAAIEKLNADWQKRFDAADLAWRRQVDELRETCEHQERQIDDLYRRLGRTAQ